MPLKECSSSLHERATALLVNAELILGLITKLDFRCIFSRVNDDVEEVVALSIGSYSDAILCCLERSHLDEKGCIWNESWSVKVEGDGLVVRDTLANDDFEVVLSCVLNKGARVGSNSIHLDF